MEITERLTKLFNATRCGRLPVYYLSYGNWYTITYADLLNMRLREIIEALYENKFKYDDNII